MTPTLQKIFTLKIYINSENTLVLGPTRTSTTRLIGHVSRGTLKGDGLEAELLPNAADWMQVWDRPSMTCV